MERNHVSSPSERLYSVFFCYLILVVLMFYLPARGKHSTPFVFLVYVYKDASAGSIADVIHQSNVMEKIKKRETEQLAGKRSSGVSRLPKFICCLLCSRWQKQRCLFIMFFSTSFSQGPTQTHSCFYLRHWSCLGQALIRTGAAF